VREHALAAVGAIAGDDEGVVGEPGRRQFDEFDGEFRAGAMVGIGLLGALGVALLPFREPLAVAVEAELLQLIHVRALHLRVIRKLLAIRC